MWLSSTQLAKETVFFSIVYSVLRQRLVAPRSVGLFLFHLSICLYLCQYQSLEYCSFVLLSEVWKIYATSFVVLPQACLGNLGSFTVHKGFPHRSVHKESACNAGDLGLIPGFNSWVEKIPWRRNWQPTPIFLPGKSHWQRNMAGYSPWGRKSWAWFSV